MSKAGKDSAIAPVKKPRSFRANQVLFEYKLVIRAGEVRELLVEEGIEPSDENVSRFIRAVTVAHSDVTDIDSVIDRALINLRYDIRKAQG